jgi:hypothetical protein
VIIAGIKILLKISPSTWDGHRNHKVGFRIPG